MKQFDVYANPSERSVGRAPFLLVLPDDMFSDHAVTLVAPLISDLPNPYPPLNPEFVIQRQRVLLSPLEMANIRSRQLKELVTNLAPKRDRIVRSLDLLFTGI